MPVRLAHPEKGAAAQLHADLADEHARLESLVPRVGGDDGAEERPRRLEVVVVAVHASGGQAFGLFGREDAEAARHVQSRALPHQGDHGEDLLHDALVRPAHGEDDAEL